MVLQHERAFAGRFFVQRGTRRAAGIAMDGPPVLALMLNEYVRMDLSRFPVAQEAAVIRVIPADPERPALSLLNTNGADRWLMVTGSRSAVAKRCSTASL